jgi:hypothetical protein
MTQMRPKLSVVIHEVSLATRRFAPVGFVVTAFLVLFAIGPLLRGHPARPQEVRSVLGFVLGEEMSIARR